MCYMPIITFNAAQTRFAESGVSELRVPVQRSSRDRVAVHPRLFPEAKWHMILRATLTSQQDARSASCQIRRGP